MSVVYTVPVILTSRVLAEEPDELGNDVYDPADTLVDGVFAPGGSVESVQGQDVVVTKPSVFLKEDVPLTAIDAVKIGGLTFEVAGDPKVWPVNPFTGWKPEYNVEVQLDRVTG